MEKADAIVSPGRCMGVGMNVRFCRVGGMPRRQHVVRTFITSFLLLIHVYSCSFYVDSFTPPFVYSKMLFQRKQFDVAPIVNAALQPQSNPFANPDTMSSSGVKYQNVFDGLTILYPPNGLDQRNAMSRTDAYWPYVQKGIPPPEELIYGEFDFYFFAQLLDRAITLSDENLARPINGRDRNIPKQKIFCDIGSGTGRLVFAAATLHPQLFQLCRGVELLPSIHKIAVENLQQCFDKNAFAANQRPAQMDANSFSPVVATHALPASDGTDSLILYPMAPIQFDCGSFDDPYNIYYGDADIIFIFSSCMGSDLVQHKLAQALGRQCRIGTIIITTDYMLPLSGYIPPNQNDERIPHGDYRLKLLESIDGWCWLTGGASTAHIHLVEQSLQQSGKLEPLEKSLQDKALEIVLALESGKLSDSKAFVRNVRNNMIFNGFPECFLPKLRDAE